MEAVIEQLTDCLKALDAAGQRVAAAHVNAALESLVAALEGERGAQDSNS